MPTTQSPPAPPDDPAAVLAVPPPAAPPPPPPIIDSEDVAAELERMPPEIVDEAKRVLRSASLVEHVRIDFERIGIAGESDLAITAYLVGKSRHLKRPLWATVQGTSSSGKSHVVESIAELFPPFAKLKASDITSNALYYVEPPDALRHRFVVCGERSRSMKDDAAERTRALRELWGGTLSKLVTTKDRRTQRQRTERREVVGPIAMIDTTTLEASSIDAEDLNRRILLHTDESEAQTRLVFRDIARSAAGDRRPSDRARIILMHHAMERLLVQGLESAGGSGVEVRIPFAIELADLFNAKRVSARRSFGHVKSLVEASAVLHLMQRERDGEAILADLEDYRLARELLLPALQEAEGGLSPGVAELLKHVREHCGTDGDSLPSAEAGKDFSSKDFAALPISKESLRKRLKALADAGHLEVMQEGKRGSPTCFRLVQAPPEAKRDDLLPTLEAVRDRYEASRQEARR
jgi:hypothetical protein